MTAEKKNHQPEKKKQLLIMQESVRVLRHTL